MPEIGFEAFKTIAKYDLTEWSNQTTQVDLEANEQIAIVACEGNSRSSSKSIRCLLSGVHFEIDALDLELKPRNNPNERKRKQFLNGDEKQSSRIEFVRRLFQETFDLE